ncbi:aspartyl/asparaginyl beta-hydroxylase isoform X1 [Bombyx mori]|uniref:Aspartyl/asparaginy/proline hydroxylase domain-containing protein n=1 Tax=Bombyx mori TaxID=7091 RepID=A0A8R1WKX0_BOMMO|nr:aspartyl/asparaginyl beta-hydroxylase isoform X2 [Bombyx mori]
MSGDVQPRKRKDKRKKKDEINVDEPRGTAAALGEGDVFLHSQHDHGTGGHWCAKIIFFSLLAVLVTLIGLIILENRGLTELEANSVESRYSGVLDGWIEDAPDDHHDEQTLDLKHHDDNGDDREDQSNELEEEFDESNHSAEDDQKEDGTHSDEEDTEKTSEEINNVDDEDNESEEQDIDELDEDVNEHEQSYDSNENDDDSENEDLQSADDDYQSTEQKYNYQWVEQKEEESQSIEELDDNNRSIEQNDEDKSFEQNDDVSKQDDQSGQTDEYEDKHDSAEYPEEESDEEDDHLEDNVQEDSEVEVERIEREVSDEELQQELSSNEVNAPVQKSEEKIDGGKPEDEVEDSVEDDEDEFLEPEDIEESPVVEHITAPAGKPLPELEDDISTEKPINSLTEEDEYEKQQEQLRLEKEQASHMWLKVVVGAALLVATHAVVRRATASRETDNIYEHMAREETPSLIDRRMTLILEEQHSEVPVEVPTDYSLPPVVEREVDEKNVGTQKSTPIKSQLNVDEEVEDTPAPEVIETQDEVDKELYSDEDELDEELIEEKIDTPKEVTPVETHKAEEQIADSEEDPDDVEIIDEELEEELIEEEEISDVDDAELLSRLEAKYGRLPEPDRPKQTKDGGDSLDDDWPGEPSESYWRQQLDQAEQDLRQGEWSAALGRVSAPSLQTSARARYVKARALDATAEARRDNRLLSQAIAAYIDLLKMNERLSDKKLIEVTDRTLERIKFRGTYLSAEPVYKLLIRRFPDNPNYRNNLTVSLLMANRADLAETVLKETLKRWPNDHVALAHLGFILKISYNRLEEAVDAFKKALEDQTGPANEPRFYYHYGDALLLLGRFNEAHEVHKRGAALGHFLSPNQRSLYNVERLKSKPWWNVENTPYTKLARALERSWRQILEEGESLRALYEKEKEGLKERGEWSQLDLFARGSEIPGRCKKAPVTCSIVRQEVAAAGCRRGQIKFSAMEAGTHVRPHVGPTNCRLRMHLGLSNTKDTYIRVDKETRQWQTGKVLLFDDSFEHEVWHNGTGTRLVLIVDVWHPDLTPTERRQLPAI